MRHLMRHTQQTIADHVVAALVAAGWTGDPAVFGATPVTIREVQRDAITDIVPNTVSILLEAEGEHLEQEMGGILTAVEYELSVDVYGERVAIAQMICSDVKDALRNTVLELMDHTVDPPVVVAGAQIEFDDLIIHAPLGNVTASELKRRWRSVEGTARVYFEDA